MQRARNVLLGYISSVEKAATQRQVVLVQRLLSRPGQESRWNFGLMDLRRRRLRPARTPRRAPGAVRRGARTARRRSPCRRARGRAARRVRSAPRGCANGCAAGFASGAPRRALCPGSSLVPSTSSRSPSSACVATSRGRPAMIPPHLREMVLGLLDKDVPLREVSRLLRRSRNTVAAFGAVRWGRCSGRPRRRRVTRARSRQSARRPPIAGQRRARARGARRGGSHRARLQHAHPRGAGGGAA